jgi:hypothetical protein
MYNLLNNMRLTKSIECQRMISHFDILLKSSILLIMMVDLNARTELIFLASLFGNQF